MTREIVAKTVRAKARTEKKKDDTRATSRSRGGSPCPAVRSSSKIQASLRTGFFPTFGGVFRRAVQSRFSPPRSVRRGVRAARRGGAGPSFLAVPIKRTGTAAFVGRGICAWGGGHRSCPPPCTTETRPLGEQTFPLLCFYTSSPSPAPLPPTTDRCFVGPRCTETQVDERTSQIEAGGACCLSGLTIASPSAARTAQTSHAGSRRTR